MHTKHTQYVQITDGPGEGVFKRKQGAIDKEWEGERVWEKASVKVKDKEAASDGM